MFHYELVPLSDEEQSPSETKTLLLNEWQGTLKVDQRLRKDMKYFYVRLRTSRYVKRVTHYYSIRDQAFRRF